ncbi:hypothetical protein ACN47E_004715 [Coniothyrium glycines]
MSHLVVRPGRNAAREAKRIKEVRKVKSAIQWHEKARKERQKVQQQRWEAKQIVLQGIKWENEHVKDVRKKALRNVREDWKLGPLRPNRAYGENADKYGALAAAQAQKPQIPIEVQKNRNEVRKRKGLPLEYPLVVNDESYFPIVKEDRVVILKGPDRNKIGVVSDVMSSTHQVIVKGLNKHYYDSKLLGNQQSIGPKFETSVPLPLSDVRLVVPYETIRRGVHVYEDVVVENILMERHTTGIDPFTGKDYGDATIPEEHQFDPENGLPIFHRYIAGTRQRIEWPWEREVKTDLPENENKSATEKKGILSRTFNTLRHPITSLKSLRDPNTETSSGDRRKEDESLDDALGRFEQEEDVKRKQAPRSMDPKHQEAYSDVDTTRNIVESAESMAYTLVAPPFPDTIGEELRSDVHNLSLEAGKDTKKDIDTLASKKTKKTTEQSVILRELAKQKQAAAESMKTPSQLHWEIEYAKKLQKQKKEPLVDTETLLAALGQHMRKHATKPRRSREAAKEIV